uniref:Metalloendopeptidase n=1 Tax=Parastrongyloides trichosuri TaxID=131310 RepID=A0A0N4Z2T7_PARTI
MKFIFEFFLLFNIILLTSGAILSIYNGPTDFSKKIIYYTSKGNSINKRCLESALSLLRQKTCIDFWENESTYENSNGLIFKWNSSFCGTRYFGRREGISMIIDVNSDCDCNERKIQSYILQAFGVIPEQTRPDRDRYVSIHERNIKNGTDMRYFKKYIVRNYYNFYEKENEDFVLLYGRSYDYGSALHDESTAFSKNNNLTIIPQGFHWKVYLDMIGQKHTLGFLDLFFLNRYYCLGICNKDERTPNCNLRGYANPRNCKECLCMYPFDSNSNCKSLISSHKECPTYKDASTNETTIRILGKINCYMHIKTSEQLLIKVHLKNITISKNINKICARSDGSVEIQYKEDKSTMGLCFCNMKHLPYVIVTESNDVIVSYRGTNESDYLEFTYKSIQKDQMFEAISENFNKENDEIKKKLKAKKETKSLVDESDDISLSRGDD